MRAIKTTTISILAVGLLAGSTVGVAAQDEEAAAGTGTPIMVAGTMDDDASVQRSDTVIEGIRFEMDDPRLTGTATLATHATSDEGSDFKTSFVLGQAVRIANEDGWWSGEGTGVEYWGGNENPEQGLRLDMWPELTGAGDYDGLSAYLIVDHSQNPPTVEGVIYAGEPPPFPEVPAE
jgi:hypothetical protein